MAKTTQSLGRRLLPAAFNATWVSLAVVLGMVFACLVLLCAGIAISLLADQLVTINYTTEIRVTGGDLRGRERTTLNGSTYLSFQGIPYAKSPVGDLRFRAPQPPESWTGVRDAIQEGNLCPQPYKIGKDSPVQTMGGMIKIILSLPGLAKFAVKYIMRMKEDCLFLNVYTPKREALADNLLPVLFFIHGGGFLAGNGDVAMFGPEYLLDHDMVVVTINYRLGPLGFLSTNSSAAPGNAGLKDQVLALKWVRDNIKAFGGDPNKVTIYGESAGGASVHFHLLSPMSDGLFHQAILSSSTAQVSYSLTNQQDRFSRRLAAEMGAEEHVSKDPEKRVEFLRTQTPQKMNDRLFNVLEQKDMRSILATVPFVPVVEPVVPGEEAFLSEHPDVLVREGRFKRVPMLIGSNNKEGSLFFTGATRAPNEEGFRQVDEDLTSAIPDKVFYVISQDKRIELSKRIRTLYFKNQHINNNTVEQLVDMFGDLILLHGIHVSTLWHVKHATPEAPVYIYHFTKQTPKGLAYFLTGRTLKGAGHAEELSYVFKHHLFDTAKFLNHTEREVKTRIKMTEFIANFVKTGNPTPEKTAQIDVLLPPASLTSMKYMDISEEMILKENLLQDRMNFWDSVFRDSLNDPLYRDL